MLVTMKEILDRASQENYGVAAPVAKCELDARNAIEAAEELNAPLIVIVPYTGGYNLVHFGHYLARLCEDAKVPVALNLDHGRNFEDPILAIRGGFTSIMVDRSHLPYEENVREVKELTKIAHAVGVSVEAELGFVGRTNTYNKDDRSNLTDPQEALRFIEETGVDCLAVAIGTAHGAYAKGVKPKIDFDRLREIKEATNHFPLVLHGGSGTGDESLAKVCSMGINKVNIANDLFRSACEHLANSDMTGNNAYEIYIRISEAYKRRLSELIKVFGSENKAWDVNRRGKAYEKEVFDENTII